MSQACPCCSGKAYNRCCERYLNNVQYAKTAEQLMRSRFTAYALGNHGDYLMATWLDADAMGLTSEQLSNNDLDWFQLEIVDKSQSGDHAVVEFKAYHRDNQGHEEILHERSTFQRLNSRWLYVSGEIL